MGLNHIYKVIWSKTKNAWIVVSEIAKRDGKSSVKSVVTSLTGKSVAAVMVAMVMCGGVAFAGAGTELGGGTATKSSGIAIGTSLASEDDGIAIGQNSHAQKRQSIVIGRASVVKEDRGIAIGYQTASEYGVSIGEQNNSTGNGIAIGKYVNSLGTSIVLGEQSSGNDEAVVIGNHSRGSRLSVTLGRNNQNYADYSTLIGYGNTIDSVSANSILVGTLSSITNSSYATVVGNRINVGSGYNNAVVLGNESATSAYTTPTDTTVSGVTLDASQYAGKGGTLGQGGILSIGDTNKERQIKNVAAGVISATSTDAVNGSQLYEAVRAVTAGASPDVYMHVNDGTSTQGAGNATTNLGKANEKGGATGMYSIAIGQNTKASGMNSIVMGPGANSVSDNVVVVGSNPTGAKSIGNNSAAAVLVGQNSYIADDSSASSVFGTGISLKGNSSVAIGSNSAVYGTGTVAINGMAGRANGIAQFKSDSSVAINGGVKGNGNIAIGGVVGFSRAENYYNVVSPSGFTKTSQNSVAVGNNTLVTQSNTVMVGSYDKLYDAKANPDKSKVITPAEHTLYYTLGAVDKQYYEGTLSNSIYLGHESYAFTPDALVDDESHLTGEQSIHTKKYDSTGNIVVSNNTTGGAFGKVSKATINGDEITGFAGAQSVGAVTIGAGDYERRIQNVAAGEVSATSTDGINGSQLYAVANTLSKNMSSYMHINDGTSTQTVGNATTNYGYSGSKAGATGNLAIAGGMNAKASGQQSLSLGSYTKSEGDYSVVIGSSHDTSWIASRGQTFALGNYSVVLGRGAQTWKDNSIAIGHRTEVKGEDSIGIGKYVFTGGYGSGPTEQSSGITAVGIKLGVNGKNTNVFGQGNIDNIGGGNPILANDSTILGNRNVLSPANNIYPTSINDYATGSHILGNDNSVSGNNAIAIGNKIFVYQNSVALGYVAKALGDKSIAVGYGAEARGEESISIGTGNSVLGNKSSAIGDPSYIDTTATGTHVQGNDNGTATNPIKASESTFMGNTNLAGTTGTIGIHVVGNNNSVNSSNVMVMGNNVTVGTGLDGAVVLGHASSADQYAAATDSTINGVTFEAAGYAGNTGLNKGSIVSVGATGAERQIKNVAAGAVTATSTDAINGSQLYKTAETILKMPINMAGDSGDTVGLKLGKTVNIKGSVASGADVTDGNIAVVGDKATSTLSLKMAKNLTGLTSGTFTDATGNQTVINGAGVTVTPTGTGATPISITTSGINAGNQEIKGVKKGTTDDAAVNKKQMDDALAGISSTLTINDGTTDGSVNLKTDKLKVVGESGANALVTTTVSGDTITVGTSTKLQNAVTAAEKSADKDLSNLSTTGSDKVKTLAQDAVKVAGTGLATVSDATAAGVKTYTVNVDEGKLVIDDTTGKVGAAGSTQGTTAGKDGVATTQNVASVVNAAIDKTTQALADAKHDFAGDDSTVISRKHGEQLNIKGGASTTASDLTSGNIAVVGDTTSGTLNIKLAKALTGLTSATYTDAAGNTQTVTGGSSTISDAAGNSTVVSKGGVTTTDAAGNTTTTAPTGVTVTPAGVGATPISVTTNGISAGNKEIKNVANGTTDDAAVNKKQMDDALKGATDNTVSLGSESGSTTAKKLSTTGGIKFNIKGETGANALITTSASGDDVTIAPTAKLTAAVTAAEKSADKDLSNLSAAGDTYIKNLAKTAASWNVETNGAGTTAVAGGETVNFINGDNIAITNTGRSITIGTAKNVSFDKVTVGGVVIDKTDGINAGNKEIKGIATGTTNDAAVNKGQLDAAIATVSSGASSTEKVVAKTLTGDTNLATVTGQTGTAKGETYEVSVSENAVKAVAATAAQDAVKVAGTGLATVSDATAAGVKTYTVNVDEGKLVIDDTTGKVGAAGSTQGTTAGKDGVATTQNVASVVNAAIDKTTQALADAEHKFDGDTGTTSVRKHGEVLSIKGGVATSADLTTGNIGVVSDGAGTLNIRLAKVLTGLTSATYTDASGNTQTVTGGSSTITDGAGNTTTITKGGMTTTDGTNTTTVAPSGVTATDGTNTVKLNGSGIDAGNTEIKHVGKATTDDAAVNKKQMDDAVKTATDSISTLGDNKVSLGSDSGTTTAKKLSTSGGIKFNIKGDTGANALITTSATGDDVTVAPTAKLTAAVTAAENAANKDLSNLTAAGDTYIKNLAKAAASWNVETNGAGTTAVAGGETVNFINGDNIAITNTGQSITIGTAKNVSFDKVTVGGVVIDKTDGINAGNKEIKGIATGTTNDAAVNKGQLDAAIATVSSGASSTEKVVAKTLTGDTNLATVTGQTGTAKGETYEVSVSENAVKAVAATAAQDAVKVAGTGLATVSDATAAGVKTYTVNVDEGKLVIDDTTGKVGAAGSTQGTTAGKDGVATTQNVASVVNAAIDKTTQALADAKHDFAGDDSTVISRKHGEKLNIKGGASTTAADLTSGNIAVLGDATTGTLNIRMAKALTGLSSATFTTPSGTTVINGGGMTITPSTTGAAPISITTGGINAGNTEIKNVAAGTTPNSAVNKQQMDSAISNATANVGFSTAGNTGTGSVSNGQTLTITGTNGIETNASGQSITVGLDAATRAQINNATTTANNAAKKDLSNIDNAGKQVIKDTAAWNVKVNGAAAETVKGGDTVTFNDGDNIKVTNTGKDITIATKKDVSFDKVTVGNVVIDKNTNRISGLANAANNDEAVNLGQMNAAISTATAGTSNIKYKANGGTQNSVALTTGFDFKGDSNIQITADPANSGVINYKLNPALTGITSISGGTGAPTITLNAGSGSTPGNVSINSNLDMGGKQINNIGAATHAGDAVNKAQMDQALQNIAGASSNVAKSYAYKAGAGAAALAALKPIQYDPLEPTQIMAGIGNYKSQTAVALGVAHYTNENTMFNLGVSLDSHDGIVNAGVTHKFGYSPEKKAIPDKYKGGPISSIYVMQDEVTALQAIVQKQAAENEALRQQNEDMQRKVDMILSKIH